MPACCYIIYSQKLNRFYTGVCQEELNERIRKHNDHSYSEHRFAAAANDWALFLEIQTKDFPHAVRIERAIKAMKSSIYIQNLKKYPDLLQKIWTKTSN